MKKKKSKRRFALITVFILLAVLLWIFRNDLQDLAKSARQKIIPGKSEKPPQERILERERKQLEEILKRR
ncbi:MAG: hypothetical protein IH856_03130 [Deltaproteobacteria bacterium]|nr:hypothetical protein [Deltaproteobacteria bacterium]MCZ6452165.1 hypothetical protein [Deltaproteobacteria bacterium]MCZ6548516.1 hypothetical protein [Deltaproteobacteria bacterium]MCZ6621031.1 hypothetical protein [Deltaproteobacteria bacterium]MCZ6907754.1 hypothetical protein [Deltaproteobacteria bacterium]